MLALLACLILSGCGGNEPLKVGGMAPELAALGMDGKPFKLGDMTPGKVTVVQFYAGACCDDQLPATNQVYLDARGDGVSVLAVNVLDPEEVVREQIERLGLAFQVALDPMRITVKRYDVLRLPTTFIIDGAGVVRGKIVGRVSREDLARRVKAALDSTQPRKTKQIE